MKYQAWKPNGRVYRRDENEIRAKYQWERNENAKETNKETWWKGIAVLL